MQARTNYSVGATWLAALLMKTLLLMVGCGSGGSSTSSDLDLDKVTMKGKPPPKPPPEPADPAIAYTAIVGNDVVLMVMNADASNQRELFNIRVPGYSWSPDGSMLAFRHSPSTSYYSVSTINVDGSGFNELIIYESQGSVVRNAWSPAEVPGRGPRIAYSYGDNQNHDIWLISPEGGTPENITNTTNRFEWEDDPAWSPDATRLAYAKIFRADPDVSGLTREMWVHDFTTGEATRVDLGGPFSNSDVTIHGLDWARTQDKIAFHALTSESTSDNVRDGFEIWVVDLSDPANPVALTDDPNNGFNFPSWSPDDSEMVYVKGDTSAYAYNEIWKMNADGSGKALLIKPAKRIKSCTRPDWKR